MNPKVSIIVPCYNGEGYIEKCFDTILNSNYENIEIIAVDDGSKDSTPEILKRYEREHENFKAVICDFIGVSESRNEGIKAATGEYIQFADSDDLITPDSTKKLVEAASCNADLVIASFYQNDIANNNPDVYHRALPNGTYNKKQFIKELSKDPGAHYYGVLWNKLYKTRYIKENNIRFDSSLNMGEDFVFNMEYLSYCEKIVSIEDKVYIYMWGVSNSLSNIKKDERERIHERLLMYYAYRDLYNREKLKGFWNFRLHFYIMRCYFNELDYLEEDSQKWQKELYKSYISSNGISGIEFKIYHLLRKIKQILR